MTEEIIRPSPKYKTVSFFSTCMVDMIFPTTGISTIKLFDHLGIEVEYPSAQTCCGQPAFNAGFQDDARPIAKHFINTFLEKDLIVTPSGSCASMIRHYYVELFKDDPKMLEKATHVASITWELSEYLVDGLGIRDVGGKLPDTRVAFHHACHGLRLMHLKSQARTLIENIKGVTIVDVTNAEECCGFGGLFAVKMPQISGAMLDRKITGLTEANVDRIITGDCGCLAQINGGLSRAGISQRVTHFVDVVTESLET